jgi:hypothetical protein
LIISKLTPALLPPAAPASERRGRRGGKQCRPRRATPPQSASQTRSTHPHDTLAGAGRPGPQSTHARAIRMQCRTRGIWPRSPQQPSAARACVWRSRRIIGRGAVGTRAPSPDPLALALSRPRAPRPGAPAMTARAAGDTALRMRPQEWPSTPQRVPQRTRPGNVAAHPHASKHTAAGLSRSKSHLKQRREAFPIEVLKRP